MAGLTLPAGFAGTDPGPDTPALAAAAADRHSAAGPRPAGPAPAAVRPAAGAAVRAARQGDVRRGDGGGAAGQAALPYLHPGYTRAMLRRPGLVW